jgi:hypothetical protein
MVNEVIATSAHPGGSGNDGKPGQVAGVVGVGPLTVTVGCGLSPLSNSFNDPPLLSGAGFWVVTTTLCEPPGAIAPPQFTCAVEPVHEDGVPTACVTTTPAALKVNWNSEIVCPPAAAVLVTTSVDWFAPGPCVQLAV